MKKSHFPKTVIYFLFSYLTVICFFFLFRLVVLPLNANTFSEILSKNGGFVLTFRAFLMGFRFDTVIACYVLAPVLSMVIIAYYSNIRSKIYFKVMHYFMLTVFSICFLISMIDIPYFNYFFQRFTVHGLVWMSSPGFVFKMIFETPAYLISLIILLITIALYVLIMRKILRCWLRPIYNKETSFDHKKTKLARIPLFIVLVGICFLGIRGRIERKSPIRVGTAYFSNNPMINQMGLNPVFTFMKSIEEAGKSRNKELHFMPVKEAQTFVKRKFEQMRSDTSEKRAIVLGKNTNVVLVIMESMGACYIGHFGNGNRTPNLDYLLDNSVSYENVYTAGIHTYNGIYSSLFGQPALMAKHTMKYAVIPKIKGGLPKVLDKNGYQTYFFINHDAQFDNISGFLSANGVEKIIDQKSYPESEVKSNLGVPDHIMFNKIIATLNARKSDKPFFAAIMTASNHDPLILPTNIPFKPKAKTAKNKEIEYCDWAIGKFIKDAQKSKWFNNTLFVFVADHGANLGYNRFAIPLTYHHTPYIYYCPSKLKPKKIYKIGLQLDTPAMICSYLGIDDKQTLGIPFDIYPRKYAYFSGDNRLGVLDSNYFYVWNTNGKQYMYKYKTNDHSNYINDYPKKAKAMQYYADAMLMNSQAMIKKALSLR